MIKHPKSILAIYILTFLLFISLFPITTAYADNQSSIHSTALTTTSSNDNADINEAYNLYHSWEYLTPDYIITELSIPLSYENSWYTKGSKDALKAVKDYYYLGTIIYNDTLVTGKAAGSLSNLSDTDKTLYQEMVKLYKSKYNNCKSLPAIYGKNSSLWKRNASVAIIDYAVKKKCADFPLMYKQITGDKFDWYYWEEEGINGVDQYEDYGKKSAIKTTILKGKVSNYAKKVQVTGYDKSIVKVYTTVYGNEGRVYVKGLKKGSTTLTVKTILNDARTVTYNTKVSITDQNSQVQYKTYVNPLSYNGYFISRYGSEYLGFQDVVKIFDGGYGLMRNGVSTSHGAAGQNGLKSALSDYGVDIKAMDFTGLTDQEKFEKVYDICYDIAQGNGGGDYKNAPGAHHRNIRDYLDGAPSVCEDFTVVWATIARYFGFLNTEFLYSRAPGHSWVALLMDGKIYEYSTADTAEIGNGCAYDLTAKGYSNDIVNTVSLEDIIKGKIKLDARYNALGAVSCGWEPILSWEEYLADTTKELKKQKGEAYVLTSEELTNVREEYDFYLTEKGDNPKPVGETNKVYMVTQSTYSPMYEDIEPLELKSAIGEDGRELDISGLVDYMLCTEDDLNIVTFNTELNSGYQNYSGYKDSISFQYYIPYVEKAFFGSLKVGAVKQLNLINSEWADWSVASSNNSIATVSSTGKLTMTGKGTATITFKSKKISGLSMVVKVSTNALTESKMEDVCGTFCRNKVVYNGDNRQLLNGVYMKIK